MYENFKEPIKKYIIGFKEPIKNIMATVVHTQVTQAEEGDEKKVSQEFKDILRYMRFKENLDYTRPFFKRKMRERKERYSDK